MLVDGMVDVSGGLVFTVAAGFLLGSADADAARRAADPADRRGADDQGARRADQASTAPPTARPRRRSPGSSATSWPRRRPSRSTTPPTPCSPGCRGSSTTAGETAVRDRVLDEGVMAFSQGSADVGLGLVLLVSAGALAIGTFDVGTLALFVAYLGWLSFLPRMVGRMLARRKQAGIAVDRMRQLVAGRDAANTVRAAGAADRAPPARRAAGRTTARTRVPLQRARGRAACRPATRAARASTTSRSRCGRGEFVVLTGPVGSGKSTLLRAVLGLAWQADVAGEVRWNGEVLADRGRVPRAAERGVPAPGAAARVGLGARQRRARPRRPGRPGPGAARWPPIDDDIARAARRPGHADRSAWPAPVGRPAPAAGDGAGARPRSRAGRARRPVAAPSTSRPSCSCGPTWPRPASRSSPSPTAPSPSSAPTRSSASTTAACRASDDSSLAAQRARNSEEPSRRRGPR